MELLLQRENEKFYIDHDFDVCYLAPIARYVLWKLESNQWDDYNELFHATALAQNLKKDKTIWFDTHFLCRDNTIIGVLLIVGGEIKKLENKYLIENENESLLLKYFHISDKGKGKGTHWLKNIIFPYYCEKGYKRIYVNSSHPDSFPFYERFGLQINTYEQMSDNNCFCRVGRCFRISL